MQKENPVIKNYILSSKKRILEEKTFRKNIFQAKVNIVKNIGCKFL